MSDHASGSRDPVGLCPRIEIGECDLQLIILGTRPPDLQIGHKPEG